MRSRIVLAACLGALALVLSSTATADGPSGSVLVVGPVEAGLAVETMSAGPASATMVTLTVPDDAPPAAVTLSIPAGYSLSLQPGPLVGQAVLFLGGDGLSLLPEDIEVADAASFASSDCAPGAHAAVWSFTVSALGQHVTVPIFVDPAPGGGYTLRTCFPPASFSGQAGSPIHAFALFFTGATLGAPTARGSYLWHALTTPLGADGVTPAPSATKDYQALVATPSRLAARWHYDAGRDAETVRGRLTLAGAPAPRGVHVDVLQLKKGAIFPRVRARPKTSRDGSFRARIRVTQTSDLFLSVEPYHPRCTTSAPAGCSSNAAVLATARTHVTVPR